MIIHAAIGCEGRYYGAVIRSQIGHVCFRLREVDQNLSTGYLTSPHTLDYLLITWAVPELLSDDM
jgi:hypothetical protein